MKFTKMHSAGNDYIYVNGLEEKIEDYQVIAKAISDRHFGVGGDGLVVLLPSKGSDFRMRIFNSDGSEAEMCGNATCSIGKYIYDHKLIDKKTITLETLSGQKIIYVGEGNERQREVSVAMGAPILDPNGIPVIADAQSPIVKIPLNIIGREWISHCVSMGNPHSVIFTDNIDKLELEKIGPEFEHYKLFPNRTNTEFIEVLSRTHLKMRVWERGAGETLACGTGACASLVASVLTGKTERKVLIDLVGGRLGVEWKESDNQVYLNGYPVTVFTGEW